MGAGQSQPRTIPPEPYVSPEERAQAQAEVRSIQVLSAEEHGADFLKMRAKQQAALDKRLANQRKNPTPSSAAAAPQPSGSTKKLSALEQMSRENVGWRNADANHEMRSWN
ncbi:hypothetical protein SVAN01_06026 [Stagonosporopsis vannaccii]|nr:hypothetical protein SVAN01_06026 [Stagonosporopsis vannaccii]